MLWPIFLGLEPRRNIPSWPAFSEEREKAWLALLLAWVAGYADAFGWLKLNHIFTSHMSGNSVSTGTLFAQHQYSHSVTHAYPILLFGCGFIIGAVLENATRRLQIRRRFSLAAGLEAALLLAFLQIGKNSSAAKGLLTTGSTTFYLLISLLAGAMGIQSAALRRVRGQSIRTPFVTGMLTQSLENAVLLIFSLYDRLRNATSPETAEESRDCLGRTIFYGGIWLLFVVGAICGGYGEVSWDFAAMSVPLAVLAFIIICDIARPIYD